MRSIIIAAALVCAAGCLLPKGPGVKAGERLVVVEDSALQQMQGTSLDKLDHRTVLRGTPGSVLPVGAVVEVVDRSEPRVKNTGSDAPLAHRNPWIYVVVRSSPLTAQEGWEGWIHHRTTKPVGTRPPEAQPFAVQVAQPSKLCPFADSNKYQCSAAIAAGTPVRVIECGPERVRVELWERDQGLYVNGFVGARQLDHNPCNP
jgi:hypothetical protein